MKEVAPQLTKRELIWCGGRPHHSLASFRSGHCRRRDVALPPIKLLRYTMAGATREKGRWPDSKPQRLPSFLLLTRLLE